MDNEKIKQILLDIHETSLDFTVTQTGKESRRVNGFYKPDTHEIFLHNKNFKSDNQLVYTAVHEYTHHLMTEKEQEKSPAAAMGKCRVHTQEFWAKFSELLEIAEKKGYYSLGWENSPELKALTEDIKVNYLEKNGELMQQFGKKLAEAYNLCVQNDIRYEDYIDRVLCLPRNAEKDIRKVGAVPVNPAIGFENMKVVASIKKPDERAGAEKEFLSGKNPVSVREMMKQKSSAAKGEDPKSRLEKEKNRLEKTIAQLTQRLEYVEESLANL